MWEHQMLRSRAIIQSRVIETLRLISGALSPVHWIHYFHTVTIIVTWSPGGAGSIIVWILVFDQLVVRPSGRASSSMISRARTSNDSISARRATSSAKSRDRDSDSRGKWLGLTHWWCNLWAVRVHFSVMSGDVIQRLIQSHNTLCLNRRNPVITAG